MLYICTYVRICAHSHRVRKVVKSEGAGIQTIRKLRIKVHAIYQEYIPQQRRVPLPYTLGAIYGIIQHYIYIFAGIAFFLHILSV